MPNRLLEKRSDSSDPTDSSDPLPTTPNSPPLFHHSIIPSFPSSIIPFFHHSTIPSFPSFLPSSTVREEVPVAQVLGIAGIVGEKGLVVLGDLAEGKGVFLDQFLAEVLEPRDAEGVPACRLGDRQTAWALPEIAVGMDDGGWCSLAVDIAGVE